MIQNIEQNPEQALEPTQKIQALLNKIPLARLEKAFATLQARYRDHSLAFRLESLDEHLAYLLLRMPATQQVNFVVLEELQRLLPSFSPNALLDIGAGPGSATLAATSIWDIKTITCLEQNRTFITLAKELLPERAQLHQRDARSFIPERVDLAIASYSLGELSEQESILEALKYMNASTYFVLIEPGTPLGNERVLKIRSALITAGYYVLAPCPHQYKCPMIGTANWCHFSTRVARSSLQRQVKAGSASYEDEKFSYIIAGRAPITPPAARIVQTPKVTSGYVELELCTPEGAIQKEKILKREGPGYKVAKKLRWGDSHNPQ